MATLPTLLSESRVLAKVPNFGPILSMSKRELKALVADQKEGRTTERSRRPLPRRNTDTERERPEQENLPMEELQERVKELEQQLQEVQEAIKAGDRHLREVSAECERASGEARVVSELASGLTALTGTGPSSFAAFFQSFLESQQKLLATQTNALAVQSAPPLPTFTGDNVEVEKNGFEKWLERFEERATLLAWEEKQKCYQLKSHLASVSVAES